MELSLKIPTHFHQSTLSPLQREELALIPAADELVSPKTQKSLLLAPRKTSETLISPRTKMANEVFDPNHPIKATSVKNLAGNVSTSKVKTRHRSQSTNALISKPILYSMVSNPSQRDSAEVDSNNHQGPSITHILHPKQKDPKDPWDVIVHDKNSDRQRAVFRKHQDHNVSRSKTHLGSRSSSKNNLEDPHQDHFGSKTKQDSLLSKLFNLHASQRRGSHYTDESHHEEHAKESHSGVPETTPGISRGSSSDGLGSSHMSPQFKPSRNISPPTLSETDELSNLNIGSGVMTPETEKEEKPMLPFFRPHSQSTSHSRGALNVVRKTRDRSESDGASNIFRDLMQGHRRTTSTAQRDSSLAPPLTRSGSDASLASKYGRPDEVLGKGAQATIRLETLYAVKEYRKRRRDEQEKEFVKKLIAEFCISSSMHHENIVHTVDLIQNDGGKWCQIMEYCPGGDLLHKASTVGFSSDEEIYCIFRQILSGVAYIHSNGVAHRDLKPENILLDSNSRIIKITDFGVSAVFKTQFEKESRKLKGVCGSGPYIAPEEWDSDPDASYYPTKVDVWAIGMILYAMLAKSLPWMLAQPADEGYATYLKKRETGYPNFERWFGPRRELLYLMFEPDPIKRPEVAQILELPFVKSIKYCRVAPENHEVCIPGTDHIHAV